MKKLVALARTGLKSNFGLSLLRHKLIKERKDLWIIPVVLLGLGGIIPLLYSYLYVIKKFYGFLQPIGQQPVVLTFGILAGQLFILLLGFYYVLSAFYFSRDLDLLIPLPYRPFEVMLSKFIVILVNEYLSVMPIVLPIFVYYGLLEKAGPAYWLGAAAIYVFLPVIPLAIVATLAVGLMRAANIGRKKDALIIVGSLVLMILGLALQFYVSRSAGASADPAALARFFASSGGFLRRVGGRFPPSIWATNALAGGLSSSGLENMALFVGVSLGLLVLMVAVAERLFYRGLIGLGETSGRKHPLSLDRISHRVSSGRRPVWAIFLREWRVMNRTPIFLLNGVLVVIIIPIVFLLMMKSGRQGLDVFLLNLVASGKPYKIILGAACFMAVCGCLNGTASSTFSREGKEFWISKVVPVTAREHVLAKFFHSYVIALLGILAGSVVEVAIFHIRLAIYAAALFLALVGAVVFISAGMAIDLARPLLEWTNPQKAIKQNLNVVIAFFTNLGIITAFWGVWLILARLGVPGGGIIVVLAAALIAVSGTSFRFLVKFAERRYKEIEV
jgi:ABC-2 type transport system permease protein